MWDISAVKSMRDDQTCANGIRSGTPTSQKGAPSGSMQKGSGTENAIQSAKRPVADSPDTKGSPQRQLCRRSLEASPASTSSTSKSIQRCPVTNQVIPSLKKIEETIEENLVLSNWHWPRSIAVKGIALALRRWALEVGLERAAERGEILLSSGNPMKYADLKNLPWIPNNQIEELTPEAFADRLGGIVDELESNRNGDGDAKGDDRSDQCLLQSPGVACEDCRAGGDPEQEVPRVSEDGDGGFGAGAAILEFPSDRRGRGGLPEGLSRSAVVEELVETKADLLAFRKAYDIIHCRVQNVKDESRLMKLVDWSGTAAVMGSMDLSIHALERTSEELRDILRRIDRGVIPNLDEE